MQLLHPSLPKQRLSLALTEYGGPTNAVVLGGNVDGAMPCGLKDTGGERHLDMRHMEHGLTEAGVGKEEVG